MFYVKKVSVMDEELEKEILKELVSCQQAVELAVDKIIEFEERLDMFDSKIDGIASFVSGYQSYKEKVLKENGIIRK